MRVRKLSPTGDMTFGRSGGNYYSNDPAGVAQVVDTRLRLWLGQWFLKKDDGTVWMTRILGKYTTTTRDSAIQARILGTPGVLGLAGYNSQVDAQKRTFTVQATIDTVYGSAPLRTTLAASDGVSVAYGR